MELVRGWRFACSCTRCTSEALENPAGTDGELVQKDESKVEESVSRIEANESLTSSLNL
jgi:mitochondrial import receptor subunit TOM20